MVERRRARRTRRLHHRPTRLLDDRPRGRPRRADPASRQRDADRRGGRAFLRITRTEAHPRSRHRPGHLAARRARRMAHCDRARHRRFADAALVYAQRNAERLGLRRRAEFRLGDWAEGIDERFDLILCNPPYVAADAETGPGVAEYEPAEALFAGPRGSTNIAASRPRSAAAGARRARGDRDRPRPGGKRRGLVRSSAAHSDGLPTISADGPRALLIKA